MGMWDSESLWLKAKTFFDTASGFNRGDSGFGLWSALGLELLGRSALSSISPALNADPKSEQNLFFSLGLPHVGQPRSIPAHSISDRLQKFIQGFDEQKKRLFDYML